jgi:hypothetical protein
VTEAEALEALARLRHMRLGIERIKADIHAGIAVPNAYEALERYMAEVSTIAVAVARATTLQEIYAKGSNFH